MIKNKLVAVLGVPMGAVWAVDHFITNMPMVLEGGAVVAGVGGMLLGAKSIKKLLHTVTAEQPAEQGDQAPSVAQEGDQAPPAPTATVHALPAPERVQEALQQAFLMGAQAAKNQQQLGR